MRENFSAVEIYFRARIYRLETYEFNLGITEFGARELLQIPAFSAIVVVSAVLPVDAVPRVGQVDVFPIAGKRLRNGFCRF